MNKNLLTITIEQTDVDDDNETRKYYVDHYIVLLEKHYLELMADILTALNTFKNADHNAFINLHAELIGATTEQKVAFAKIIDEFATKKGWGGQTHIF